MPHGWRSSFSTIMNERAERELGTDLRLLADRLIIDLMLAHTPAGMSATELRYSRARYMDRRLAWAAFPSTHAITSLLRQTARPPSMMLSGKPSSLILA